GLLYRYLLLRHLRSAGRGAWPEPLSRLGRRGGARRPDCGLSLLGVAFDLVALRAALDAGVVSPRAGGGDDTARGRPTLQTPIVRRGRGLRLVCLSLRAARLA